MQELDLNRDSSEDYRSVIDDLTIQNQRLKRKLRKYERLYSSHLQKDKLFEVTFHGLSAEKRRELENILREFVFCSDESSPDTTATSEFTRQHLPSHQAASMIRASPYVSQSRPQVDSGYGSISASGQTPTASSYQSKRPPVASENNPGRDGQSQPNNTPYLNTHAKKALIVERLEQLFTGKALRGRPYNQVLPQPNVSGSAADADRMEMDPRDPKFNHRGVREARILPAGLNTPRNDLEAGQDEIDSNMASGAPSPMSTPSSSEQRPTRPLDLDLRRTQYPAENIDYIRHLGISTPSIDHAVDSEPTEGWVYFNLLVNMAQLHTLSVMPEFIRQAVIELSTKLELSEGGRKIRWKGETQGTKMSSDSSSGAERETSSSPEEEDEDQVSKDRRVKRGNGPICREDPASTAGLATIAVNRPSGHSTTRDNSDDVTAGAYRPSSDDRFYYKPLFFHATATDEEDSDDSYSAYSRESSLLPEDFDITGYQDQSHIQDETLQRSLKLRRSDCEGPLIFYKRAGFCTDLSGDRLENVGNRYEGLGYEPLTEEIIGCHSAFNGGSLLVFQHHPESPLLRNQSPGTVGTVDDELSTEESMVSFRMEPISPLIEPQDTDEIPRSSVFEVSGLAGVHPADHFKVNVQILRKIMNGQHAGPDAPVSRRGYGVGRIRNGGEYGPERLSYDDEPYTEQIISATRVDLPPSTLPPPSCVHQPSSPSVSDYGQQSSSSSDSSDEEDYDTHSYPLNRNFSPPQLTRMLSTISTPGPGDLISSKSSSIDLLASLRKEYPSIIAEQEKEYDDRYNDLISHSSFVSDDENEAGSSAATAGDKSSSSSSSSQVSSRAVSSFIPMPNITTNVSTKGRCPYTKRSVDCVDTPHSRTGRDKIPRIVRDVSH